MKSRERIAIVGGGIAGITSAYILSKKHDVTLFEASNRLGGHANAVKIADDGRELFVDTGFLIFNSHSYKNFLAFLKQLGLSDTVCNTDMSIGIHDELHDLTYAVNAGLNELFHQRKNIFRPKFYQLVGEIKKFRKLAGADYLRGSSAAYTLGEYLTKQGFSKLFMEAFAYPLGASVWSLPGGVMEKFPADLFFYFFSNHKILKTAKGATWQTIKGSSIQYVRRFEETTPARIVKKCAVFDIERSDTGVVLNTNKGEPEKFDRVVLATHADTALKILKTPSSKESRLLGVWRYQDCSATLHTDSSIFPSINNSWPSWNIHRSGASKSDDFIITYYLNRIQQLETKRNYFVTLNSAPIRKEKILEEIRYRHPVFTVDSLGSQKYLPELNSERTFFCGSYFGNGFHEDAVNAALSVTARFGLGLSDVAELQ